jgi:hypothetical protein
MWQRWNQSSHIFEKSTDNGGSWTPLGLNASIITEGTLPDARLSSNVALEDVGNGFTAAQSITGSDPRLAFTTGNGIWGAVQQTAWGLDLSDNTNYYGGSWHPTHGSYPSWFVRISSIDDVLSIYRAPAGGSIAYAQLFLVSNAGRIYERGRSFAQTQRQNWSPTVTTAEGAAVTMTDPSARAYFSVDGDMVSWFLYWGAFTVPAITAYLIFSYPPGYPCPVGISEESSIRCYSAGNRPGYTATNPAGLLVYQQQGSWPAGATQYALGSGSYHIV